MTATQEMRYRIADEIWREAIEAGDEPFYAIQVAFNVSYEKACMYVYAAQRRDLCRVDALRAMIGLEPMPGAQ